MSKNNCKVEMGEELGEGGVLYYYVQSPSTISHANSCSNNLSRSSSRASNNNTSCFDHHHHHNAAAAAAGDEMKRLINNRSSISIINDDGAVGGGWLSFSYSPNSTAWILLQVSWRFVLSLGIALLVFYMATKPPNPNISIKVSKIREYEVGEGVDGTGVSTKILNCNISLHLFIHNPSNLFPLHIQPPLLQLSFGTLSLSPTPTHIRHKQQAEQFHREF